MLLSLYISSRKLYIPFFLKKNSFLWKSFTGYRFVSISFNLCLMFIFFMVSYTQYKISHPWSCRYSGIVETTDRVRISSYISTEYSSEAGETERPIYLDEITVLSRALRLLMERGLRFQNKNISPFTTLHKQYPMVSPFSLNPR